MDVCGCMLVVRGRGKPKKDRRLIIDRCTTLRTSDEMWLPAFCCRQRAKVGKFDWNRKENILQTCACSC